MGLVALHLGIIIIIIMGATATSRTEDNPVAVARVGLRDSIRQRLLNLCLKPTDECIEWHFAHVLSVHDTCQSIPVQLSFYLWYCL